MMASVLLRLSPEAIVTRRTLGFLATLVGSALGAWWIASQQRGRTTNRTSARDRGTVIFDNTPMAVDSEGIL
jgi:hypothetical protein